MSELSTMDFLGIQIAFGKGALIPRKETELLGRTVLAAIARITAPRVVDMCCGTGNLACAIAALRPDARVWACELTDDAVALARHNVTALALGDRVTVRQGDLFAGLAGDALDGTLDAVVCNPPYISTGRLAERGDLSDEPREAFDGGPYGLTIHQRVIREAVPLLVPGGLLAVELGVGQGRQVELLFQRARAYEGFELTRDDAGEARVALARKKP